MMINDEMSETEPAAATGVDDPSSLPRAPITIVFADDHPIFRRGLKVVIESDPELNVVGEAGDGLAALAQIEQLVPDVAVLDVDMPGADGLAVVRAMGEKGSPTPAVFLTMHRDQALFDAAIAAGVKGFVIKDSAATDIVACIRAVAEGQTFFSASLSEFMSGQRQTQRSWWSSLTVSERRILRLIAEGKSSREIAEQLFVSNRTVEHHRARMSAKLSLTGKNGLLSFALLHKTEIQRSLTLKEK
jgi:DNA-binding NarL/FixJ family response regulator